MRDKCDRVYNVAPSVISLDQMVGKFSGNFWITFESENGCTASLKAHFPTEDKRDERAAQKKARQGNTGNDSNSEDEEQQEQGIYGTKRIEQEIERKI